MDGYARFNAQVPRSLLQQFHVACESREDVASQVVREFMRRYVAEWENEVRRGRTDPELLQRIAQLESLLQRSGVEINSSDQFSQEQVSESDATGITQRTVGSDGAAIKFT